MINKPSFVSCAVSATALLMAGPAMAGDDLDTFEIEVILEELQDAGNAQEFEDRLAGAAWDYCKDAAPRANRRSLKRCQTGIIEAVEEVLAENAASDGIVVAWTHTAH